MPECNELMTTYHHAMPPVQNEQVCGLHRGRRLEYAPVCRWRVQKYLQENTMGNTGLSLGIDIGGTFTDLVLLDPRDGKTTIWKEPTTADDPSRGAMLGLAKLLGRAATKPEEITRVIHATTLFTNALIERKGQRPA
jgi:activator of 2-hydroxyglutaryl-CoA dehydratase